MFSMLPVERSSMTYTSSPRAMYASDRCEPMNPAPPVISTFTVVFQLPSRSGRGRTGDYSGVLGNCQRSQPGRGTDPLPETSLHFVQIRGTETHRLHEVRNGGIDVPALDQHHAALEVDLRPVVDGQRRV